MKFKIRYFIIIIVISFTINSCYISSETDNGIGNISVGIPIDVLIQKSVPAGTPGFEVIIAGGNIADPQNITEDDEIVLYYRDKILTSSVITEWGGEQYLLTLDKVPEGDNLYIIIKYYGYDGEVSFIKYFMNTEPFSVKDNETTYLTTK